MSTINSPTCTFVTPTLTGGCTQMDREFWNGWRLIKALRDAATWRSWQQITTP